MTSFLEKLKLVIFRLCSANAILFMNDILTDRMELTKSILKRKSFATVLHLFLFNMVHARIF